MKKRFVALMCSLVLAFIGICPSALAADEFVSYFDISGDGKVNSVDARYLLQKSAGLISLTKTDAAVKAGVDVFGDCNGDGKVNSSDARYILQYSARLIDESRFHIGAPTTTDSELVDNTTSNPTTAPTTNPTTNPTTAPTSAPTTAPTAAPTTAPTTAPSGFDPKKLPLNRLLSAKDDHGLGRAKMIVTKSAYAEMTPAGVQNMRSYPLMNPYIKGMTDYVSGSATYYGDFVYLLKSGAKIEAKDVEYLANGYVLPDNRISAVGVYVTSGSTDVYIKPDWLSPVCVQFKPQKYFEGYEGRAYNLSSFTAEYVELQFSHTKSGSGTFQFPAGSIFKSASFSVSSATKVTTLRLYLARTGSFYGYDLSVTNGYIKFSAKNKPSSVSGKTIVLDPGHGGSDPGGGSNGIYEAGINLKTALHVKSMLEKAGAKVIMTRSGNTAISLNDRVALTRRNNADLFLSIHCDVSDATSAAGVSVYYYYPYSMPFARSLQTGLVNAYRSSVYSPSSSNYSKADRDIKFYPFQVARVENCPAVLIELGFLTNYEERTALQKDSVQMALAGGIYNGIVNYFSK